MVNDLIECKSIVAQKDLKYDVEMYYVVPGQREVFENKFYYDGDSCDCVCGWDRLRIPLRIRSKAIKYAHYLQHQKSKLSGELNSKLPNSISDHATVLRISKFINMLDIPKRFKLFKIKKVDELHNGRSDEKLEIFKVSIPRGLASLLVQKYKYYECVANDHLLVQEEDLRADLVIVGIKKVQLRHLRGKECYDEYISKYSVGELWKTVWLAYGVQYGLEYDGSSKIVFAGPLRDLRKFLKQNSSLLHLPNKIRNNDDYMLRRGVFRDSSLDQTMKDMSLEYMSSVAHLIGRYLSDLMTQDKGLGFDEYIDDWAKRLMAEVYNNGC